MAEVNPPSLSRDDYTVGWISALAIESAAAAEILDAEEPPLTVLPGDTNDYVLGRIGRHHVVMACINEAGGLPAHVVATHMMKSFPSVRHMLMVGIGAGIPSEQYPIRLGDVVVSEPTRRSPGVVQSDLGKWEMDGFKVMGSLNRPAESLVRATGAMKRNHLRQRGQLYALVRHFDANVLHPDQWQYQGLENDPLHQQDPEPRLDKQCAECAANSEGYAPDPRVHYGVIASGDQVVKSRTIRDKIQNELGACCVEMEAFGLLNHFPCLVIRGVSDYADEHKNDRWQQYAALTAAAYGKELLLQLSAQNVPTTSEQFDSIIRKINAIQKELHTSKQLYEGVTDMFQTFRNDHEVDRILKWLSPSDPAYSLSVAKERRCENTGSWFIECEEFQDWVVGSLHTLCLEGIPGSGKTVLSSKILDYLQKLQTLDNAEEKIVALGFFFDFKKPAQQTLDDLLRSLVTQLYIHHSHTQIVLNLLYKSCNRQKPQTETLSSTFRKMLERVDTVHLVIDGLDECKTRFELLSFLQSLTDSLQAKAHLLITTRREKDIQLSLKQWLPMRSIIQLCKESVDSDIQEYICWRLREDVGFGRWRADHSLQDKIVADIMRKADGI
ncbi:nucleoside phosphorylase domain-containing protein [Aspergillus multicolor]|uniref:nucleoside phosphorylase domain-containing protein n=1 Tax=Aspergillus multicolor TaxID=41759 RepID=UPI003CCE067A